jgi:hypothetical protein
MPDAADEIFDKVLDTAEEVLDDLCRDVADDLRTEMSIPVDYSTKPPTRSKPGEYPRLDTGALVGSVSYVVYRAAGNVKGVVATAVFYDKYVNATRPFANLIRAKWQSRAEQRFEIAFRH